MGPGIWKIFVGQVFYSFPFLFFPGFVIMSFCPSHHESAGNGGLTYNYYRTCFSVSTIVPQLNTGRPKVWLETALCRNLDLHNPYTVY